MPQTDLTDKQKIYRVFQLIRLLSTSPARTVRELVSILNTSKSDIYRLLNLLEELGYPIDTDSQNRKFMQVSFKRGEKPTLESDELFYLQEVLQQHTDESYLASSILQKFDRNLHLFPLADALPHLHQTRLYQLAQLAMEQGCCVELLRYGSTTSGTVPSRIIEPLSITTNRKYLIGWEPAKQRQGQFKFARMQHLKLLTDQPISGVHIASPMDLFGLTGDAWLDVQLELSGLAHQLLVEEFPQSQGYIQQSKEKRVFQGPVRSWIGVGRFVLGLPGEVIPKGPSEFLDYLEERQGLGDFR